jgi:predicted nucleic acid-binding protein
LIGYLDTSAFVPLLVAEPSTPSCRRFWDDCDAVVSTRLLYVEAAAALAQAHRMKRLTTRSHLASLRLLDELWAELAVVEIAEQVVTRAAALADELGLRGYDAVHCSSAEIVDDDDVVAASGDQQLLSAWSALGLSVYDTN